MIYLYSGTPGSGKSFHVCEVIWKNASRGRNVIANFPIRFPSNKKLRGDVVYAPNKDLTVDYLVSYATECHDPRKEHQTLVVIDEAGNKFNSRNWHESGRMDWLTFFSQHRKMGFDVILVAQDEAQIDKQIRACIEVDVNHRRISSYGFITFFMKVVGDFVAVEYYHGTKTKLGHMYIRYRKKIANIYDTFAIFE